MAERGRRHKHNKTERISPIYDVLMTGLSKQSYRFFVAVNFKLGGILKFFQKDNEFVGLK